MKITPLMQIKSAKVHNEPLTHYPLSAWPKAERKSKVKPYTRSTRIVLLLIIQLLQHLYRATKAANVFKAIAKVIFQYSLKRYSNFSYTLLN